MPQGFDTLKVHGGYDSGEHNRSVQVPIYQTAAFDLCEVERAIRLFGYEEVGFTYSRIANPTVAALEKRIAALDGAAGAVALSSGMAAISYAILTVSEGGGRVLTSPLLYGGTADGFKKIYPAFGIKIDYPDDAEDPAAYEAAIRPDTRAIFVESISNPNAVLLDIDAIAEVAHRHGIPLIVDNTFATPYLYRALDHGADIAVYSATKQLNGHGNVIAGVVTESGRFDWAGGNFPQFTEKHFTYRDLATGRERSVLERVSVQSVYRAHPKHLPQLPGRGVGALRRIPGADRPGNAVRADGQAARKHAQAHPLPGRQARGRLGQPPGGDGQQISGAALA